jgi:hypothetical protein
MAELVIACKSCHEFKASISILADDAHLAVTQDMEELLHKWLTQDMLNDVAIRNRDFKEERYEIFQVSL